MLYNTLMNERVDVAVPIVLNKDKKVLVIERIGLESDPNVKDTIWVFPGTRYSSDSSEIELKMALVAAVKHRSGYQIDVGEQISERDHTEFNEHIKYFGCNLASLQVKPIKKVDETIKVQWVDPEELVDLFTTSLDPGVAKYLGVEAFPAKK